MNIVLYLLISLISSSLSFISSTESELQISHVASISWDKTSHDFGDISQNMPVEVEFELTNKGEESLVITAVKASCGCTATAYDDLPIAPGTTSKIKATYNAKKTGKFTKHVKVFINNTEDPIMLEIKGTVIEDSIP